MQLLAMVTMLIDHLGIVLAPDEEMWRVIGRLAFPLYAYAIVQGYARTSDFSRYLKRLILIGLLSQIPFMLALGGHSINVIGTFIVCLLVLKGLDRFPQPAAPMLLIAAAILLLEVVPFDYGSYALLLVLIFRYASAQWAIGLHVLLNFVFLFYKGWFIQFYSVVSTILIYYLPKMLEALERAKIPRWLWRSFYPAHLAILAIVQALT